MLIQAHLAMACKVCFIFVRYLVLLFLVWKIYWNMVASTLLHFYLSSKGMDSTFLRTSFLSTCSLVKYLQVLFPFELSTDIFHWSCLTGIAVWTSAVVLSVTCKVCSSVMSKSNRESFPCMPLAMNSMPLTNNSHYLLRPSPYYYEHTPVRDKK